MKNKFLSIVFLSMFLVLGFGVGFDTASAQVATFPSGCSSTMGYSTVTGLPCNGTGAATLTFMAGCTSIFGYSTTTGLACNGGVTAMTSYFPGCTSVLGASTVTGLPCSGGPVPLPFLAGCESIYGFSTVNGLPCNGTLAVTFDPGLGTGGGTGTPGLPTTGAGGNAMNNLVLLIGSGLISLFGIAYIANRMRITRHA
ncbi:MAG: hypothetical protein HY506_02685 [Candidatus Yanofskybacteria bacterium]|nr:hypothetical protein [Candidatus Yanofskybacteria bacterium]